MNIEVSTYKAFIIELKSKIQTLQIKASISVNKELLKLYWEIAQMIVAKQQESSWGDNLIEQISKDLKREFPAMKGFSVTNIKYMRKWYLFWNHTKSPQLVGEIFKIPWGHNREIDGELRESNDNPTLGILICKSKNNTIVEYALNKIDYPIGVSEYQLVSKLPKEFKSSLPSIEEIEAEIGGV